MTTPRSPRDHTSGHARALREEPTPYGAPVRFSVTDETLRTANTDPGAVKDREMHIFIHIPSSAGTTLWSVLRRGSGGRIKRVKGHGIEGNERIARGLIRTQEEELKILGGHIPYGFADDLLAKPNYFTFLRRPEDRLLSAFYRRLRNQDIGEPNDLDAAVLDYARDNRYRIIRYLTGAQIPEIREGYESPEYSESVQAFVRERYFFVGIVEDLEDSLFFLAEALEWTRIPAPERRNTGSNRREIRAETHTELARLLKLECEVYEALKSDFDHRKAAAGHLQATRRWLARWRAALLSPAPEPAGTRAAREASEG
jgi:hypothetical protein